ncbi:hypothetical protein [Streptosporangium sp. NPDC002721]|uniref:hypothetical protein n=1 Tax=Streptosporangium sp. NPDC002721 TaxID=3366188 RepID=UPI0036BCDDA6
MTRWMRTCSGVAYDLGYLMVWCPKYRCPVLGGWVKGFTSHHLRSQLPTLWLRSSFVARVGAVSADIVRRSIDTHYARAPMSGGARA